MDSRKSKILWFSVATSILIGLVYFAEPSKFLAALLSAKPLPLIPAFIFGFSVFFVFTNTWNQFMKKVGVTKDYFFSFRILIAGHFMNSVTPLGNFGGEPFMAYIIKRNTDLSYEKAFSTVLSADIMNAIPAINYVILGTLYLLIFRTLNDIMVRTLYATIVLIIIGTPIVYLMWFKTGTIEGFIIRCSEKIAGLIGHGGGLVQKIKEKMEDLQHAFEVIGSDRKNLVFTGAIAHLTLIFQLFCLYLILYSLGHDPHLAPLFFIIIISSMANFAPTPGGTGAYEATMATVITVFLQIPLATALTAAVLFRLTTYWPGMVVGYASLLTLENDQK